jgi:hypothetical protein
MLRPAPIFPLLSALVAGSLAISAQTTPAPATARIVFTFDHPQLQPARYTIAIDESGAGHFTSEPGPVAADQSDGIVPAPLDRPIQIDDSLRAGLFRYARTHNFFGSPCSTTRSGLAFIGNKTFTYTGADGKGSCSFVWAADPTLQRISDQLGAVAFTVEEGWRLDIEVQHDRLGLDAELENLQDAVQNQRASDLPNIASQLQAIAEDQRVMDRARKRAVALLARCGDTPKRN